MHGALFFRDYLTNCCYLSSWNNIKRLPQKMKLTLFFTTTFDNDDIELSPQLQKKALPN
jgi:hypothetical protein